MEASILFKMSRVCIPVLGTGDWNSSVNRIRKMDRIRVRVCCSETCVCGGGLTGKMSCKCSASAMISEALSVFCFVFMLAKNQYQLHRVPLMKK